MPTPTLIATAGATNANSYSTLAEAQSYFDASLYSDTWNLPINAANSNANQIIALIMATRMLDSMYTWKGYPTNPSGATEQALQWPRVGLFQRNRIALVDYNSIPQELKNATAELAQQILVENRTLDSDLETKGVLGVDVGSIHLRFKDYVYAKVIPDAVFYILPPHWGDLNSRVRMTREVVRS